MTEIQTNLHIWGRCNQIQQYFPFIIYAMWLMFNKMAEICTVRVPILDVRLFFCVFTVIFMIFLKYLEHFRDIFQKMSKYLENKSGISGNMFRRFFVIFALI